jgi:hypothetical protein
MIHEIGSFLEDKKYTWNISVSNLCYSEPVIRMTRITEYSVIRVRVTRITEFGDSDEF